MRPPKSPSIIITNATGKPVLTQNILSTGARKLSIDIQQLSSGLYFIGGRENTNYGQIDSYEITFC